MRLRNPLPEGEITAWFVCAVMLGGLWCMVHFGPVLTKFPTGYLR